jgi:hypothetical protein
MALNNSPNTGTELGQGRTNSGLSTQIIIKINGIAVGALQNLTVNQNRPLKRVDEIGTDGNIEIVPTGSTTYDLTATRIVFDQMRLPEAFSRGFRFIAAQRIPFDIEIIDLTSVGKPGTPPSDAGGIVVMTYKNCWFSKYSTPYTAADYLISETADIWAETAYVSAGAPLASIERDSKTETDAEGIESSVNTGGRRGAMDASGVFNSIMKT